MQQQFQNQRPQAQQPNRPIAPDSRKSTRGRDAGQMQQPTQYPDVLTPRSNDKVGGYLEST